ncbi:MAG: hypothetical protein ACE5H3_05065 [Planctomycetota bacterium]
MVGLILVLLQAGSSSAGAPLARLENLLQAPRPGILSWRRQLFETLRRLEGSMSPRAQARARSGWGLLAASGEDKDRANLVLYQRRHDLPLLPPEPEEGPETTLERCLAHWGREDGGAARSALRKAAARFPEDARFAENLLWLDLQPPESLDLEASPRNMALAVLSSPFRSP